MHSKLVLYFLALLTGLAVGPHASAAPDKTQPVEQCASAGGMDAGPSAWFAELSNEGKAAASARAAPKTKFVSSQATSSDCGKGTPVTRKDTQRK